MDKIVCLGDIVGYGAHPGECIELVQQLGADTVAGNHDWGVLHKIDVDYFNADARDSIEWTREQLSDEQLRYLESLPLVKVLDDVTLVHSSLFAPDYFDYLQTLYDLDLAFERLETTICFVGHSHVPVMFVDTTPVDCFLTPDFQLPLDRRAIINAGSVGQPRDLNPHASYVLYDSGEQKVYMRRIEYDVQGASQDIIEAGLPTTNAVRLVVGR